MKTCVKAWSVVPYGGVWWFIEPNTGIKVVERNRDALMRTAAKRFKDNNLPVGLEFESYIEELVCRALPNECAPCRNGQVIRPPHISPATVLQGIQVWVKSKFSDAPAVDPAEARRRAGICNGCPWKVQLAGGCGGGCGAIEEAAAAVFGAKDTGYNLERATCSVCSCYCRAMVWVDLQTQQSVLSDQQRADFKVVAADYPCWKAEGL